MNPLLHEQLKEPIELEHTWSQMGFSVHSSMSINGTIRANMHKCHANIIVY